MSTDIRTVISVQAAKLQLSVSICESHVPFATKIYRYLLNVPLASIFELNR